VCANCGAPLSVTAKFCALHARITEALERLSTDRGTEQAERLAHHALRGELWERAVAYLRQAGLRAMARAANREAIAHLEQALGALRRLPEIRETTELTIDIRLDLRNALMPMSGVRQIRAGGPEYRAHPRRSLDRGSRNDVPGHDAHRPGRVQRRGHLARAERRAGGRSALRALRGARHPSATSGAWLADVLCELGRFDEAIWHAEAAVRIAEAADHPFTLYWGLFDLGRAHLRRGDLPRATRVLERCHDLCRTWQIALGTPYVAATLGAAYALAGRADEALPLVAGAVEEFRRRQIHGRPAFIFLFTGMTYLSAGRIDEAASHAREALALTRRLGARASEAHALCLAGDVASTRGAADAEGYYREALALAGELGMHPIVAHCHLGLGKLYAHTAKREQAREHLTTATTMYSEMDMQFWLAQAALAMTEVASGGASMCRSIKTRR
jgi:tetratricopeptide (TPR) repeat protein